MRFKRKVTSWVLAFCMIFTMFIGINPNLSLLKAEQRTEAAVLMGQDIIFSYTTSGAYAVGLAGEFNNWNADYNETVQLEHISDDSWTITLEKSRFHAGNNYYKFVTFTDEGGIPVWEEGENRVLYIESDKQSPIISEDGIVTINANYSGETLYLVGDFTNWAEGQIAMTQENGIFTYTFPNKIAPGTYGYKFKPHADDWDESFTDTLNTLPLEGGNSVLAVPGIRIPDLSVAKGKSITLSEELPVVNKQGISQLEKVTYSLKEDDNAVQLEGNVLRVGSAYDKDSIVLTVSQGVYEQEITIKVVSDLYSYKINYYRPEGDYTSKDDSGNELKWNLWLWCDSINGGNGAAYDFDDDLVDGCKQFTFNTKDKRVNFIVRNDNWDKDIDADRKIELPLEADSVEVWLVQGDSNVYYERPEFDAAVNSAFMDSPTELILNTNQTIEDINSFKLKDAEGNVIETVADRLTDTRIKLTVTDGSIIDASALYTVSSPLFKAANVTMRDILSDEAYYYEGNDLGASYSKSSTTFKLWAPTAQKVILQLDNEDESSYMSSEMTKISSGVWVQSIDGNLAGRHYTFTLSFADGTINENVVDPYAKAVTVNGGKGVVVDLEETDPEGFRMTQGPKLNSPSDAVIYETHVRDFSIQENNFEFPGKYLAFTETGRKTDSGNAIGIDHLKELGITHVQIQPIYDFGSVDETAVSNVPAGSNYNWGYDPQNYNVPEGSYATQPENPISRINELKQMVQALHNEGIGVIMDVVYNHTYSVENGPFEKVVPGYFYRTDDKGNYTDGSGCGNEVASERPMVRKFIMDSAKYWAEEYGMDGFRFDLMGLIDTETIKQITTTLENEVNPNIIVYGEPWTGGSSSLSSELQTTKGKQKGYDFGIFNDNLRGAIKGDSDGSSKGFATGSTGQEADIIEGISGGIHTISQNPTEVVSYVTAHDNLNLWDKVLTTMGISCDEPYADLKEENVLENEAVKRSLLANGIVLTSQGISFIHSGEELLRSKYGDANSYKSSDEINMINWENKDTFKAVSDYYKGLIALRKAHPAFRMTTGKQVEENLKAYIQSDNIAAFILQNYANGDIWKNIVVIYNANDAAKEVVLPHKTDWHVVVNDENAGCQSLELLSETEKVQVAPLSMMVLYDEALDYEAAAAEIQLNSTKLGMALGSSKLLKVTVKDQNGSTMTGQSINYTSSDEEVVQVSSSGKITAVGLGKAEVNITCGKAAESLDIEVVEELIPASMVVSAAQDYVYQGMTLQMTAKVYDQFEQEMSVPSVKWQTGEKSIAVVDISGKVTGVSSGRTVITAVCGKVTASCEVKVKSYEKRYIVLEYIRPDEDYTDWNLWVWSTGVTDGQIDFTDYRDGKAIAYIEIGPETENVGFIVRKGTDWNTAKQDIENDRFIYTAKDQLITKAQITAMVNEVNTFKLVTAPVIDVENDCIHFYYRNDELFKSGKMSEVSSVQLIINEMTYDMIYDSENELFCFDYTGLETGRYYYKYIVNYADGTTETLLDVHNTAAENNASVIEYKKLDLKVEASITPQEFNFRESAILNVDITSDTEDISSIVTDIKADLSAIGGRSAVNIDTYLKELALTAGSDITPGIKQIPVKVYDSYGNIYKSVAEVEVESAAQEASDQDFDWDEAVIYFMITDRFYNGDSSNDNPEGFGYNLDDAGAYHGGDLKGVTKKLDYLQNLGVNTIWITPVVAQIDHNVLPFDDPGYTDVSYYAYHGYWAKNFEQLNPHLGTLDDFHELIDEAHARNMKIMVDVVINHAGYGLKETDSSDVEGYPTDEDRARFAGMLRTDGSTDSIYGELSNLPDFITEDPQVREKLLSWQVNWVENLARTAKGNTIDYFRLDTAKHVDKATLQAFKSALLKVKPDFRIIAEAWLSGSDADAYLNNGLTDSILNFDFKTAARNFVSGNLESAESYLETLNDKADSAANYGNFLGSHDEDGFLYSVGMENTDKLLIAATLQITSKGQPVIYYGEEIGLSGQNNWPYYDNRYDMDWQQVSEENNILTHYRKLLNIRKENSLVFARGTRTKLSGSDEDGFLVFDRSFEDEHIVVAVNSQREEKMITFNVPYSSGTRVKDVYSGKEYVVSTDKTLTVALPASTEGGTVILMKIDNQNSGADEDDDDENINQSGSNSNTGTASESGEQNNREEVKENSVQEEREESISFKDVPDGYWAKDYIDLLVRKGIAFGRSKEYFAPAEAVTRAEFCTLLGRALKIEQVTEKQLFKDVKAGSWYSGYVNALSKMDMIKGYEDGSFMPDQKITRQEMAAILVRAYNIYGGEGALEIPNNRLRFKDEKDIAAWAKESVIYAQSLGFISGREDNRFLPTAFTTRAETAKVIVELMNKIESLNDKS